MKFFVQNKIVIFLIKYFRFTLIGVIVILLFISFYFLLIPKYLEIREEGGLDYESKVVYSEARKKELERLKILHSKLAQTTSAEIQRLERILPTSSELPNIFVQMENLARESGLEISRIGISEGEATEAKGRTTTDEDQKSELQGNLVGVLNISLAVEGDNTYMALKKFLDSVEDNMRIVDLNSLSFSSAQQEQKSYSVSLKTYYLQ